MNVFLNRKSICLLWMVSLVSGPLLAGEAPWPSAASDAALRTQVSEGKFSAEERRNIRMLLDLYSEPDGWLTKNRTKYFSDGYKIIGPGPFYSLDKAYGKPGGFNSSSLSGVARTVKDVIAKGNEVWVIAETSGKHSGPFFGVPASGKTISWPERSFFRFDNDGRIAESLLQPQQAEIYKGLGGQMTFPPGGWECKGCPDGTGKILPIAGRP